MRWSKKGRKVLLDDVAWGEIHTESRIGRGPFHLRRRVVMIGG